MYRVGLCFGDPCLLFWGWICVLRFGFSWFVPGSGCIGPDSAPGNIFGCCGDGSVPYDFGVLVWSWSWMYRVGLRSDGMFCCLGDGFVSCDFDSLVLELDLDV